MNSHAMETIHLIIEWVAVGIELLAVAVIGGGVLIMALRVGTFRYLFQLGKPGAYENYRQLLGKALLLGMELLVAADVVRTIALEPTLKNLAVLSLLVFVRTFLGWALSVEIEGHWPWQARARTKAEMGAAK